MRFKRYERIEPFEWTARKAANALAKPARQAAKLAVTHPLFADQLAPSMAVDLDAERAKRDRAALAMNRELRLLHARVWRESRCDYFAAPAQQRADIREAWRAWTGPVTALYFRYVVDLHTGVQAAREQRFRFAQAQRRSEAIQRHEAQRNLELPDD